MSKFPRETIVLLSAIAGANLFGIFTHANSVQSLDCNQSPGKPKDGVRTDIPYALTVTDAEIDAAIAREREQTLARRVPQPGDANYSPIDAAAGLYDPNGGGW